MASAYGSSINGRASRYSTDSESSLLVNKSLPQMNDAQYLQNLDEFMEQDFPIKFNAGRPTMFGQLERIHKIVHQRFPTTKKIELLACGPHHFDLDVAEASLRVADELGTPTFNFTSQTFML